MREESSHDSSSREDILEEVIRDIEGAPTDQRLDSG
jgi:hypothetical protein